MMGAEMVVRSRRMLERKRRNTPILRDSQSVWFQCLIIIKLHALALPMSSSCDVVQHLDSVALASASIRLWIDGGRLSLLSRCCCVLVVEVRFS